MNILELEKELKKIELKIFTTNDLVKFTGKEKNTINHFLSYQKKRNRIKQLKKGVYSFENIENKFHLSKIFNETYISLNSALEFYQMTTQRFNVLDLITKKPKKKTQIDEYKIEFTYTKHFFGFHKINVEGEEIFIANKEKVIIDCLLNLEKTSLEDIFTLIYHSNIDLDLLLHYLKKINSPTLNKRIGYLFSLKGINLDLQINNKYDLLNPLFPKNGKKNTQWKLYINEEIENG